MIRIMMLVVLIISAKSALDIISPAIEKTFGPMIAVLVSYLLKLMGYQSATEHNMIYFDDISFRISSLCTGIDTIVYFMIMVFTFFGLKDKRINYLALKYSMVLFLLNILRIALFRPVLIHEGLEKTYAIHNIIYNYIQGFVMLGAFALFTMLRISEISGASQKQAH